MKPIIFIQNLSKVFGSGASQVTAVDCLDLVVKKGEIFGFLGTNGAGKTTTMRMLTTLLKPTSGTALVAGHDLHTQGEAIRKEIGYVSQSGGLERSATARENLVLQGRVFGMSKSQAEQRAQELIEKLDLTAFADRLVETYSGGQRRRADIALGMVNNPKLLFLDEPTIGLDPQSRAHVWEEMKRLRAQGTTIFFTTHYLDEADLLCDRIAIVDHGKIVALDTPLNLKREIASDIIILGIPQQQLEHMKDYMFVEMKEVRQILKDVDSIRLLVSQGETLLPRLLRICDAQGIELTTISLHRPTLDDVFLHKTGRAFKTTGAL